MDRPANQRVVIYALIDEREPKRVRYVGQTSNPRQRYVFHQNARSRSPVAQWSSRVPRLHMRLLEVCNGERAASHEIRWINRFRRASQADLNYVAPRDRLIVNERRVSQLASHLRAG